jgi:uncharacterized Zn-binding protein involved in type VI secretion
MSALAEAVVYAAATALVAAAIAGTVVAVVGTGGAAAVLVPVIAGALVGGASMIPVGDRSIGEAITDGCDSLANWAFPAEPFGKIESGSQNTHVNGKPAARAAGRRSGGDGAHASEEEAAPSFLENIGAMAMSAVPILLPVLGLGMAIDDIFNPPVTTPAAPGTEPAEQDKVTCERHPPMPDAYIAQGSSKVFINGQPAARAGDKTTCDAAIDSDANVSPNVRIGGEPLTVRDIRNGKSKIAQFTGMVAGMLISRKIKLRPRPKGSPKPWWRIGGCKGNPVFVSTGGKILGGPEDLDFTLPGLLPIEWARGSASAGACPMKWKSCACLIPRVANCGSMSTKKAPAWNWVGYRQVMPSSACSMGWRSFNWKTGRPWSRTSTPASTRSSRPTRTTRNAHA